MAIGYWVAENGVNCPAHLIIPTESECKVAVATLGLNFEKEVRYDDRPSGCYKQKNKVRAYFNGITDPDSTSPRDDTAAICGYGMINSRYVLCYILTIENIIIINNNINIIIIIIAYLFIEKRLCHPDPCNQNGATGEVCASGVCTCNGDQCGAGQMCTAGACSMYRNQTFLTTILI